nr:hypothetical protein [Tanacetum cinerariifolium]
MDFLNTSHIKYAFTENPIIYASLIQQFWQTVVANTLDTREVQITAIIDGKVKLVSEAFIRRHLKLEDSNGSNSEGEGSTVPVESHHTPSEKLVKSNKARRRAKVVVSDDEDAAEDTSKQGRKIDAIGQDPDTSLVQHDAELDEEEKERIVMMHEEASSFNVDEWEDIQATTKADEELALRIQAEEREKYYEAEKARLLVDLINQRKRYFAQQRAEERRYKPLTRAQQRTYMAAEEELEQESSKRQKTRKSLEPREKEDNKLTQEDLQQMMMMVPVEEVYVEALQIFADMLKKFDRDDMIKLWDLVKERFSTTEPTDDKEKELWVELKRLFELDNDDTLWKLQKYMHDPLVWRLYDTCGVHHVSLVRGHDIFMLVEKEYPWTKGLMTLMLANKLLVEQSSEMANELLRKIFILAKRPRQ